MVYSEDITEQGRKCEIVERGVTIPCIVICTFQRAVNGKIVIQKYRLQGKDKIIYDNVLTSDIKFIK